MAHVPPFDMPREEVRAELDRLRHPFRVAIDRAKNPFNIGAVIRTAHSFLAREVVLIGTEPWYERAAMGMQRLEHLVELEDDQAFVAWAAERGLPIVAFEKDAARAGLWSADLPDDAVLTFGNEDTGVSPRILAAATEVVGIPMYGVNHSYPVTVAAGIAMAEWARRRYERGRLVVPAHAAVLGLLAAMTFACSGSHPASDGGVDSGSGDAGGADVSADGGPPDAVGDASVDGPTDGSAADGGELAPCPSDSDCAHGAEWCVPSWRLGLVPPPDAPYVCVACDNSGMLCDLACPPGESTYERNGCYPCACVPTNECTRASDCGPGDWCYAGAACPEWCAGGDPSCCYGGNRCDAAGCTDETAVGCHARGCPPDEICTDLGCTSSECLCTSGHWSCTRDCGGGTCIPPV